MASVKKGITVASPKWWKHLKWAKRQFWKRQRVADKDFARIEADAHPEAVKAFNARLENYRTKFKSGDEL